MIIQKMRNKLGFTLIELMVAIAIVAICIAILLPIAVGVLSGDSDTGDVEIVDQSEEVKEKQEHTSEKEDGQKL